eukprot:2401465-Amphidinium_carterae.1
MCRHAEAHLDQCALKQSDERMSRRCRQSRRQRGSGVSAVWDANNRLERGALWPLKHTPQDTGRS